MRVFVENLQFLGRHGVYDEERVEGRTFRVDLAAHLPDLPDTDAIDATLDYRALAEIVTEVAESQSVSLIETLGKRMVALVFERHAEVGEVELTIRKRATGVPGDPAWVGVSFDTTRESWANGGR